MNGDALIVPVVAMLVVPSPEVGRVEVGTLRGSEAEIALAVDVTGKPGCVAVGSLGIDPVVAGGNGAMVVGATPACWVGCPACACGGAWELVWACTAPKPPSHIAIAVMNMRRIASSRRLKSTEMRAPSAD
jgi:hypothetical protein